MTGKRLIDPEDEDAAVQAALLNHVLDEHPSLLRKSDLIREMATDSDDWVHRDVIERAIAELVQRGLFDYLVDYVLPTRAAVHARTLGRM